MARNQSPLGTLTYRKLSSAEDRAKSPVIRGSITVCRDLSAVFDFMNDPATFVLWMKPLKKVDLLTDGPVETGSRFNLHSNYLGKKFLGEATITIHEPNRMIECRSVYGKLIFRQKVDLERREEETHLTLTMWGETENLNKFQLAFLQLMLAKMGKDMDENLASLKKEILKIAYPSAADFE